MAKTQQQASDVKINFLELVTPLETFDLTEVFMSMNIYENIYHNSMTLDIVLNDSINLPYYAPILGEEYLNFEITTESIEAEDYVSLLPGPMYTVTITNRHITNDRQQIYILHCTSEQDVVNSNVTVSRSFRNKPISSIVENILDNDLNSDNTYDIEDTKGIDTVIIPNWKPFEAINWLAKRAVNDNDVPNYLFWETIDFTHFRSIDSILAGDVKQKFVLNPVSEDAKKLNTAAEGWIELNSLEIKNQFNVTRNIETGYYASKLITHDIVTKTITQKTSELTEQFTDEISHTDKFMPISTTSTYYELPDRVDFAPQANVKKDGESLQEFHDSKIMFYPKHNRLYSGTEIEEYENNVEKWLLQRNHLILGLNQIKLVITFPGVSYLRAGDKVFIKVPSPERVQEQAPGKIKDPDKLTDKYLSGNYLITKLKHAIDQDTQKPTYTMIAEVVKDSLGDVPSHGEK